MGAPHNVRVTRGDTWEFTLTWLDSGGLPRNLTGWTAALMVRADPDDVSPLVSVSSAGLTANGVITGLNAAGEVIVEVLPAATQAVPVGENRYGLRLTSPTGKKHTLMEGVYVSAPNIVY